ncbi:uncharacterized protein LOC119985954 isoform X1 [Tripterygium wilfordii]|nr:uncharacterized protein LOC119985954 isoform X1 [Tripterygium wilfordii]XP_038686390.1 uncharacterized protein LOC119985954 isoform X1 [Tripterygium wilfordii]
MAADTSSQDQRKRTLEALNRRFAVAEAELLQQKKKNGSKPVGEDAKVNNSVNFSPMVPSTRSTDTQLTTSFTTSANKGKGRSLGHTALQDAEENGPAYFPLSHPVHENLLTTNVEYRDTRGSFVHKFVHELLQKGDSAQKFMQGSRSIKIDNWILLDNYVHGRGSLTSSRMMALQSHSKRSKRHMSVKQHKKCGSFDLPQHLQKYDVFKPMNEMWKDYMMQLVKTSGKNQLAQCLLNADLHGAYILVAESKITAFTGVSGIIVRETAQAFAIITQENKFRVVPKKASVFICLVDCWKITLIGDKLTSRKLGS